VVLAQSAALGSMVIAYSRDKSKFAAHLPRLERIDQVLATVRQEALLLADRDAAAYEGLSAFWKRPASERAADPAWVAALDEAIAAPMAIADLALTTQAALASLREITSKQLASDLRIALILASAAIHSALLNVEVNLPLRAGGQERADGQALVESRRAACDRVCEAIQSVP
jgi:formiminotetrahydrofolate cyclodeaminase